MNNPPPPPQGYAPGPPPGQYPPPGQTPSQANYAYPPPSQQVMMVPQRVGQGSPCPQCQQGIMETSYTSCGVVIAICFFPLGIGICWMMREYKCPNCGYTVEACNM